MTARLRRLRARARALKAKWLRAWERARRLKFTRRVSASDVWRSHARAERLQWRLERAEKDVREERERPTFAGPASGVYTTGLMFVFPPMNGPATETSSAATGREG